MVFACSDGDILADREHKSFYVLLSQVYGGACT